MIDSSYLEGQIDENLPDNDRRQNTARTVRAVLKTVVRWVRDTANQVLQANTFFPQFQWNGTKLRLRNPDGSWAPEVELQGFVADEAVSRVKLDKKLQRLLTPIYGQDAKYFFVIGGQNKEKVFGIRRDAWIEGRFIIEELNIRPNAINSQAIKAGNVLMRHLAQEVASGLMKPVSDRSKYVFHIRDLAQKIVFGITRDGWVVGRFRLLNDSITETMFSQAVRDKLNRPPVIPEVPAMPAAFKRLNEANPNDLETEEDDYWRGRTVSVDALTELGAGYTFARFPSAAVAGLRGINKTGVTLQFRHSANLPIRGKNYRGQYNPNSAGLNPTTYQGNYGNSYAGQYGPFYAGNVGDFQVANVAGRTTVTANNLTFKNGDLIVQTAGGYAVQPGPGDGYFTEGDFWNVTGAGKYADISLTPTIRLVYIGGMSQSGPKFAQFIPSVAGEFFVMGEISSNEPALLDAGREGDLYIYGGSYTAQGRAGLDGDSLIYEGGSWCHVPHTTREVDNGQYIYLAASNANQWEVRRKDKTVAQVAVSLATTRATVQRRVNDDVVLFSDSMFGSSGLGYNIVTGLQALGRRAVFNSYGGGTSLDILTMMKKFIRTGGDPYRGRLHVFWHGQNNQTDVAQIRNAAQQLASLVGVKQKRYIFWSVLGQRNAYFNGERIVCPTQEEAAAGTNHLAEIERYYEAAHPGQWYNVRKAVLNIAKTRNVPDLQFPGMTEAQVAATYGILPFSFFFNYQSVTWKPEQLTHRGYRSAAGLPSNSVGADLDYYIRSSNGQIIVKVAGAWIEYAHDITHVSPEGGPLIAADFLSFLVTINF